MPQQSRDKLYVTAAEHATAAGYKRKDEVQFKRLPFWHCSLSFTETKIPVCTPDGCVFDFTRIVPWIRQHGVSPVTGEKISGKDLIRLKIHRNKDDQIICPVTSKAMNENTKVACIRPTGHVYSWEAIDNLCLKPKSLADLLEGTPFKRDDVILLQDPGNEAWLRSHSTQGFFHVKAGLDAKASGGVGGPGQDGVLAANAGGGYVRTTDSSRAVLAELESSRAQAQEAARKRAREEAEAEAAGGSGGGGSEIGLGKKVKRQVGEPTEEEAALYESVRARKAKGYISLKTTLGSLNCELSCDLAPRTCHNFLLLAARGAYTGTRFHRLIKGFMVQGGDPKGDGTGGDSAWGPSVPLLDEHHPSLKHGSRGVLSMANAGPNTGGSQFFITFAPCPHLDGKHSVFGKVVGGSSVLSAMESTPSDSRAGHVPERDILITGVDILQDPFTPGEGRAQAVAAPVLSVPTAVPVSKAARSTASGQSLLTVLEGASYSAGSGHGSTAPVQASLQAQPVGKFLAKGAAPPTSGVLLDDDALPTASALSIPGLSASAGQGRGASHGVAGLFASLPAPTGR